MAGTVAEPVFDLLKVPIQRVTRTHAPVPYSAVLEAAVTPDAAKIAAAQDMCSACDDDGAAATRVT